MHKDLVPPENITSNEIDRSVCPYVTEFDVLSNLKKNGHDVRALGIISDLKPLRETVEEFKPHIVFNLLEEFDGEAVFDQNVVSYLELLRIPYSGNNPRGLIFARDKALTKKILTYHRIGTPKFQVFAKNKKTKRHIHLKFPLIVKCLDEEASLGISQASVVHNDEKLQERVKFIHRNWGVDAIAEQFIEGREFYVGILGNYKLTVLPVWELEFNKSDEPGKELYSTRAKFNEKYREKKGVTTKRANITPELEKKIIDACKRTYKVLNLNGYARIDLRVDTNDKIYIIEANPNPDIALDDEFASSAEHMKITYSELLDKVLKLGIAWSKTD
ncbi:MAG: ATP-grasp domain-containing protein [Bacteriovoracaceae bacterium]|nr:ATP-grasp domain-containing protein [Bacteriovoracaceae bacterium]